MKLHEQIRAARLQSGLNRDQWSKAIGVTRANSYRIEKPDYNMKVQVLRNVTKLLLNTICISKDS